jgi:hypothetical protein
MRTLVAIIFLVLLSDGILRTGWVDFPNDRAFGPETIERNFATDFAHPNKITFKHVAIADYAIDYDGGLSTENIFCILIAKPYLLSLVKQSNGEGGQNAVEKNQHPISEVIQKFIVPTAVLFSFIIILTAAKLGGRVAGILVGVISYGWLFLIVWYGLL